MNQQDLPEALKNMLLNDQLKEVISRLRAHLPELRGQVTEEELLQYAARLNAVERERNLGIITAERYGIEKNQLRQILIQAVTQLGKAPVPEPAQLPDGPEQLLARGSQQYQDGEYRQAAATIQQAIAQPGIHKGDLAQAYAVLGNTYNQLGYYQEAIDAHQQALEIRPDTASYWTNLGICYRLTGQYDKAASCYEKAISLDPGYAETYTSLGALHLTHTMQFEQAVHFLEKAIALDPGQAIAYANMAIAKASLGCFDEADALLRQAVMKGYRNAKHARQMIDNLRAL
ncbi:tetratricopeptide repeat protein [Phaeodactylibacter luteus]|uniref:Tetratricopeptide repeat protein n=1 Tax=Phaeodactylibacter luteus TaxID=1564516 RepID=A0A5C6RY66_9BACT|nr:tetratricopeptide repeat protein [Phaeodactylibacter luteus]TXB66590.1 tetratricopeptide repeat protein [Phaeodactylibacter luteus]